jgi:hypothetical protein
VRSADDCSCRSHELGGFDLADARNARAALRRALIPFQFRLNAPPLFVRLSGRELMKRVEATDGDADTLIHSDRLRRNAEDDRDKMRKERDEALQREAKVRNELERMERIAGIAIITLVLAISVCGVLLWLSLRDFGPPLPLSPRCEQPQPPPPPGPASCPKPAPPPRPHTPFRDDMQRCGAPDCCWEYPSCGIHDRSKHDGGECWRDRSAQGPCFD